MSVSTINVGQKSVIYVDCSNKTSEDANEIKAILQKARGIISSKPAKSVYIITNFTNLKFSQELTNDFKSFAVANTNYVKESVLVGVNGLQLIILSAVKALTKREYHLSKTLDEAKAYLASVK